MSLRGRLLWSFLLLGLLASTTQVVALREMYCESGGLEVGLAVALSAWLLLVGVGNAAGEQALKAWRANRLYAGLWTALAAGLVVEILLLRGGRALLFAEPGDALGALDLALLALAVQAPCALAIGMLCPVGVAVLHRAGEHGSDAQAAVRKVYLLEGVGATCGGAGITALLWLAGRVPALGAVSACSVLWAGAAVAGAVAFGLWRSAGRLRIVASAVAAALVLLVMWPGFPPVSALGAWTLRMRYPGLPGGAFVRRETASGQFVSASDRGRLRAWLSGRPFFDSEAFLAAHERMGIPALCAAGSGAAARLPGTVAIVDGPGLWRSDAGQRYAARAPVLLATDDAAWLLGRSQQRGHDREIAGRLIDGRGRRVAQSLRQELKALGAKGYDLIVLGGGAPETVSGNRLYTKGSLEELRGLLEPRGVLSFFLPASRNRTGADLARYLASIVRTAGSVFRRVKVYPGIHGGNIVCASQNALPGGRELAARLRRLGVEGGDLPPEFLESLDTSLHSAELDRALALAPPTPMNTRLYPVAPLYAYFAREQRIGGVAAAWLLNIRPAHALIVMGLILAAIVCADLLLGSDRGQVRRRAGLLAAVGASGFVNLAYASILVLVAQSGTGQVYLLAGLLVAGFMLGMTLAAALSPKRSGGTRQGLALVLILAAGLCLASVPVLRFVVRSGGALCWTLPPAMNAALGFLSATAFMKASRLRGRLGVGALFASDLFGSALGGLAGGAALLPLWGAETMCSMAALVAVVGAAAVLPVGPLLRRARG